MSFIRLIFGGPEHRCQASGTVKIQTGQWIDVLSSERCSNIYILFSCWVEMNGCFSGGGGLNFLTYKGEKFPFFCMLVIDFTVS